MVAKKQASTMMWPKSMQFIVVSIAKNIDRRLWKNWRNFKTTAFQDVYTDQWIVLIFDIFCMYKNYFCEIVRPPEFRGPGSGEPPEP